MRCMAGGRSGVDESRSSDGFGSGRGSVSTQYVSTVSNTGFGGKHRGGILHSGKWGKDCESWRDIDSSVIRREPNDSDIPSSRGEQTPDERSENL